MQFLLWCYFIKLHRKLIIFSLWKSQYNNWIFLVKESVSDYLLSWRLKSSWPLELNVILAFLVWGPWRAPPYVLQPTTILVPDLARLLSARYWIVFCLCIGSGITSCLPKRCLSFESWHGSMKLSLQTAKTAPTEQREREIKQLGIICRFTFLYLCVVQHGSRKCTDVIFYIIASIARNSVTRNERKFSILYV